MVNQLHEEYGNGKIYLPGPGVLLLLVGCLGRQPSSRISLRGVMGFADQPMKRAEAVESFHMTVQLGGLEYLLTN